MRTNIPKGKQRNDDFFVLLTGKNKKKVKKGFFLLHYLVSVGRKYS
jgi:hypothetical protein